MGQTHHEITSHLAERLCWHIACRDDTRVARRLYRKPLVDGVYRLGEGALLDDFFHFLQAIEVMALLEQVHGTAIPREMRPFMQYLTHKQKRRRSLSPPRRHRRLRRVAMTSHPAAAPLERT